MSSGEKILNAEEMLSQKHTALIVVDMQNDFCNPKGVFAQAGRHMEAIQRIIPNISSLLSVCREREILVVHLQQTTLKDGKSDDDAWLTFKCRDGKSPEYCLLNSWGWEFLPELQPLDSEIVVPKFRPSGFYGTFLTQILRANDIWSTIFCGNTTEGCVLASILESSFSGFYTCVIEDATASSVKEMHETAMRFLRTRYKVFSTDEVIKGYFS